MPFSAATGAISRVAGAAAAMLIEMIAAAIHRRPVVGFCMGAPWGTPAFAAVGFSSNTTLPEERPQHGKRGWRPAIACPARTDPGNQSLRNRLSSAWNHTRHHPRFIGIASCAIVMAVMWGKEALAAQTRANAAPYRQILRS